MRKYIIFRAEKREPGWENRKLQHTQGLTRILAEYFDSSEQPIPQVGDRPTEFVKVEEAYNPQQHSYSTHYRQGDWEVVRVETYEHEIGRPYAEFDLVVICYCKYNPINAPLKPMPERQISVDSFGGNTEAYNAWLESQKQPVQ